MVLITIVTGAYKPTYNWGPHIVPEVFIILGWISIRGKGLICGVLL